MAYNLRTQRVAYDNISIANATGRERTIIGTSLSTEVYGGGSRIRSGADGATSPQAASTEPTTDYARSRIITSSGGVTTLHPRERVWSSL